MLVITDKVNEYNSRGLLNVCSKSLTTVQLQKKEKARFTQARQKFAKEDIWQNSAKMITSHTRKHSKYMVNV